MRNFLLLLLVLLASTISSCNDDGSFTTDQSAALHFSCDTVKFDTLFCGVASSTYTFWVHNPAADGVRIASVRLESGNQSGFRVNVDGTYLDNDLGAVASNLELRKGDSLRVFVELTAPKMESAPVRQVTDNLIFRLESGREQRMLLTAVAVDADVWQSPHFSGQTVIEQSKPIIVYGTVTVDSAAQLTIRRTTLYFHDKSGIDVYGTLTTDSVVMRGDRLDHMFDYLPYDRVSGQWRGLHFHASSTGNTLTATTLRNAEDAIVVDSAAIKEGINRLTMNRCVVHNCKGVGVRLLSANALISESQISNTLGDCVEVHGGAVELNRCTLAQFYPFTADRGAGLRFSNAYDGCPYPLTAFTCTGTIVTGYADDVVMGELSDTTALFDYRFAECLLRTPVVEDSVRFVRVRWESPKDSIQGKQHFVRVDEKNLDYDFHLDSISPAQGLGAY